MVSTDSATPAQKRAELRRAVVELRERGLIEAAKWAAELMAGAYFVQRQPSDTNCVRQHTQTLITAGLPRQPEMQGRGSWLGSPERLPQTPQGSEAEEDLYLLAKSTFDMKVSSLSSSCFEGLLSQRGCLLDL